MSGLYETFRSEVKKLPAIVLAIVGALSVGLAGPGCSPKAEPLTVAWSPFESSALMYIAEDQQFFTRNGLDVTSRRYETGAASLDGMLAGEADIAVGTTEFPIVRRTFQKAAIRIIAIIDRSEFVYVVARKDRGIQQVSDLKGKRVGTTVGTIAEFHLGRLLELNGLNMRDVTIVDVKTPAEWVNAVADGDIDAIATAQPYANAARDRLGGNAVFWPAQSNQPQYGLASATDNWIAAHPEAIKRFLKSLAQAEEYAARNPAAAKAIVQKRLNLEAAYMETVWAQNQFGLALDRSLIAAMEGEARWMMANNLTAERTVPNFLEYVYEDALKAVKPRAVNIIR